MKNFLGNLRDIWDYRFSPTVRRYVLPVYSSLMWGHFAFPPFKTPPDASPELAQAMKNQPGLDPKVADRIDRAARSIGDAQIEYLLRHKDWRMRMCAGWYIGLTKRQAYVPRLGEMMYRATPYDHYAYCVALALLGGDTAKRCLREFIQSLGETPDDWDQGKRKHAMLALAYIEGEPAPKFEALVAYLKQRNMLSS